MENLCNWGLDSVEDTDVMRDYSSILNSGPHTAVKCGLVTLLTGYFLACCLHYLPVPYFALMKKSFKQG